MVERADEYQNKSFLIRTHKRTNELTKPRMEAARCLKNESWIVITSFGRWGYKQNFRVFFYDLKKNNMEDICICQEEFYL